MQNELDDAVRLPDETLRNRVRAVNRSQQGLEMQAMVAVDADATYRRGGLIAESIQRRAVE